MLATPLLMSPILYFLRDVCIRTQRAAVASGRAANLALHNPYICFLFRCPVYNLKMLHIDRPFQVTAEWRLKSITATAKSVGLFPNIFCIFGRERI